jgi:ParB family transcriptional regulator, chromosome partitioning protein
MAARKSGLGRGLGALIPVEHPVGGFAEVDVEAVAPNPQQPRRRFDDEALEELAASIREVGVLQPIVVRTADEEGAFVLVAGERRLRAAAMAGLRTVPAMIRSPSGDSGNLTEALIENLQRTDLSPLEEAAAYRNLLEDFGMTHEAVAERVGKSRSAVTNTLRLLQLAPAIQGMLDRGELSAGHARALLAVSDPALALEIARRAVDEGWSVRLVEEAARGPEPRGSAAPPAAMPDPRPAAIIELEERLADRLGTVVEIRPRGEGGRLVIRYGSLDDLEQIYRALFS